MSGIHDVTFAFAFHAFNPTSTIHKERASHVGRPR
jgi:hypothetical protein